MIIKNSALAAIAVRRDQYPPEDLKEIAFAGRSNIGKSSLLNLLTGRKSLAKVSGNPGKTRTINFFDIAAKCEDIGSSEIHGGERNYSNVDKKPGDQGSEQHQELKFRIVDLPGYGYAKVSRSLSENWGGMIEDYMKNRKNLVGVVLLLDIRHNPTLQDIQMYEWLKYYELSGVLVATKADKVSVSEGRKGISRIIDTLNLGDGDGIYPVSVLKKTGVRALLAEIERRLTAP